MVVYWAIYAVFCFIHLLTCFFESNKLRKITKIFIIPTLMLSLFFTKTNNYLLFLGLFLGWLGDVFLIFTHKKKYFIAGAIFFALGHIAYITATLILFFNSNHSLNDIPVYMYLLLIIIFAVLMYFAKFKISRRIGPISYLGMSYFIVLIIAILLSFIAQRYILTLAFTVFIISDTILSVCRFAKKVKRDNFYIMTTYILAQTLICISFIYG